ncbi:MAG: hypothetical protein COA78_38790, partial [Blastopirellula sp.]
MYTLATSNIHLSVQNIGGEIQLDHNNEAIPVSDATRFHIDSERNQITDLSSIDGDGAKDSAGYLVQQADGQYTAIAPPQTLDDATHIGIYFTGNPKTDPDTGEVLPNLIRVVDRSPHLNDQGLLQSINEVDLLHTDLYVFRESNGQLVTHHKGAELNTEEDDRSTGGVGENQLQYSFVIRSPDYFYQKFHPYPDYAGWASATKLAEPFQANNADHIRVGERLKLVAINRATGYMGSTTFTSRDPTKIINGRINDINSAIDNIVMAPPRLRIWAERVHEIQQGRQVAGDTGRTNIIGNEGITLEDDLAVAIHTEWLDADGRPLPADMGDFGYTARLAKITQNPTPDVDALQQNTTHEFSIRPGRNLNVLQFNQQELTRHHYYVQVNPYPISEQNDFGQYTYDPTHQNASNNDEEDIHELPDIGSDDESQTHPLRYRPAHYVPIQVPIYDEVATQ